MRPIDKNNYDGEYGATAKRLEFPEGMSEKAQKALDYYDDTIALYYYMGKYILTDESGWLTEYGTGKPGDPWGFPRAELDSLDEVQDWLEDNWDAQQLFE